MEISFLDLKNINSCYKNELIDAAKRVIESGNYILGPEVSKFELDFAQYIGAKHCVAVGNCLDALTLMLKAYNFEKGSEIIVSANTFIATVLSITANDLVPVFVEPCEETFNIDPSKIEEKITSKTRAILIVHLYGRICDMEAICKIAKSNNLYLFEDCAQAAGTEFKGTKAGNFGDGGCYSFYPGKNFGALGDGGAFVTNNPEIADKVKALRNYGSFIKYENIYKGINSRLDEMQAAFLNVKLKYLDSENQYRSYIAEMYCTRITNPDIQLPGFVSGKEHTWHLFVIRTKNREKLQHYLAEMGIQTIIHYPIPIHKQQAFEEINTMNLPITEELHNQVLSLPISPIITEDEVDYIVRTINNYNPN